MYQSIHVHGLVSICLSLFLICSCGRKDKELTDEEIAEVFAKYGASYDSLKQIADKYPHLDSLRTEFCECLVNDSLTNEQKLTIIDGAMAGGVNINASCGYLESRMYKTFGNSLQNLGASLGNALLPGRPFRKKSSYKAVRLLHPPAMTIANDTFMLREMVARGASLHSKTPDIISVQEFWIKEGDQRMIDFVLDLDPNLEKTRLFTGNEKLIDELINMGAKRENVSPRYVMERPNFKRLILKYDLYFDEVKCRQLERMIRANTFRKLNYARAKFVLERGGDATCLADQFVMTDILNKSFDSEEVPVFNDELEAIYLEKWMQLLVDYEVDWNQCGKLGSSPLIDAASAGLVEDVRIMLKFGADPGRECIFMNDTNTALNETQKKLEWLKREDPENISRIKRHEEALELLLNAQ